MKKNIYFTLLLLSILSCKKNSEDPDPDLTAKLVGHYIYEQIDPISEDTDVHYNTEWTISKVSNNSIRINHRETEFATGPGAAGFEPGSPFEVDLHDVVITESDRFLIDQDVKFIDGGKVQNAHANYKAILLGNKLTVQSHEVDLDTGETNKETIVFVKD